MTSFLSSFLCVKLNIHILFYIYYYYYHYYCCYYYYIFYIGLNGRPKQMFISPRVALLAKSLDTPALDIKKSLTGFQRKYFLDLNPEWLSGSQLFDQCSKQNLLMWRLKCRFYIFILCFWCETSNGLIMLKISTELGQNNLCCSEQKFKNKAIFGYAVMNNFQQTSKSLLPCPFQPESFPFSKFPFHKSLLATFFFSILLLFILLF